MTRTDHTRRTLLCSHTVPDTRRTGAAWYSLWRALILLGMEASEATIVANATHNHGDK